MATMSDPLRQACDAMFHALREMDRECPTGLCDYVSCSPYAGKKGKDEAAITWGVTRHLQESFSIEQAEHGYTRTKRRCDRVVELSDSSKVWLEFKNAWRRWFYGQVNNNNPFFYESYFLGPEHGPDKGRTHSVAQDLVKLEAVPATDASYVGLLIVGFDGKDAQMVADMDRLAQLERLASRGWQVEAAEPWTAKQSTECWHRCWFWWRHVG